MPADWWRGSSVFRRSGLVLAASGLAILALLLPVLYWGAGPRGFTRFKGWVDIFGCSVGFVGLAITLIDRIRSASNVAPRVIEEVTDRMMKQVRAQESLQRARLLGTDCPSTVVANLRYRQAEGLVRFKEADSAYSGDLENVGRYFTEHTQQRLVILGSPGSGKTVLALELLIQLLDQRNSEEDPRRRAMLAVPVRFSLAAWNTARPLVEWLASDVAARFGMSTALARTLVDNDRILPVLDGLDEMDVPSALPERAAAALAQLNTYLRGRAGAPLVITCRSDDYQRLREVAGVVVRPAIEITVQPLTPCQIRDYLDREYDSSVDWDRRGQWVNVLDQLGDPRDQRLLSALQTPWRLALAVTYHRDGGDLAALLPTSEERLSADRSSGGDDSQYRRRIGDLLLSTFIPARTRLHQAGRYRPDEVIGWCRALADHLGGRVDIVPHELWTIARADRVRRWHAVVATVMTHVFMLMAIGIFSTAAPDGMANSMSHSLNGQSSFQSSVIATYSFLTFGAFLVAGIPLLALRQALRATVVPTQINLRQLRTLCGRRRLMRALVRWLSVGVVVGFAGGLMIASMAGFGAGLANGLAGGLAVGSVFGLAYGLKAIGEMVTDPRDPLQNDLSVWLGGGLTVGLVFGIVSLFEVVLTPNASAALVGAFTGSLAVGLLMGAAIGLTFRLAGHAWLRYVIAITFMSHEGRLPRRLGAFTDWASQAGILRIAGNAYQFRHVELRNWLHAKPGECPPGSSADVAGCSLNLHDSSDHRSVR